jgi:alpha-glucosidase
MIRQIILLFLLVDGQNTKAQQSTASKQVSTFTMDAPQLKPQKKYGSICQKLCNKQQKI